MIRIPKTTIGRGAVVASIVLAASATTAVGWAEIPHSETGVITACFKPGDGRLRVIDAQAGEVCRNGEDPEQREEQKLEWNVAGQQGPAGPAGGFDPTKLSLVGGAVTTVFFGQAETVSLECPPNAVVIDSGYEIGGQDPDAMRVVKANRATLFGSFNWTLRNTSPLAAGTFQPQVVCAALN